MNDKFFNFDGLLQHLRKTLKEDFKAFLQEFEYHKDPQVMYNAKDTAKRFGISLPTLRHWRDSGAINCYEVGSRQFYDIREIQAYMLTRKKGRKLKKVSDPVRKPE